MANNFKRSNAAVNEEASRVGVLLNNGFLRIYDGAQPTNADTAIGAQVLLAELRFNATAFGSPASGVVTANAFTADASANATGTAAWFRALQSDGSTVIADGSVGAGGTFDLVLNSVSIQAGAEVQVTALTYTANKG